MPGPPRPQQRRSTNPEVQRLPEAFSREGPRGRHHTRGFISSRQEAIKADELRVRVKAQARREMEQEQERARLIAVQHELASSTEHSAAAKVRGDQN